MQGYREIETTQDIENLTCPFQTVFDMRNPAVFTNEDSEIPNKLRAGAVLSNNSKLRPAAKEFLCTW